MSETQGFRHFDLPVDLHEMGSTPDEDRAIGHWVPYSDDQEEIQQLQAHHSGLLLARRQHTGTRVEGRMVELLADEDVNPDIMYLLGAAAFNAAFYSHAQGADQVMRRRLYLPVAGDLADTTTPALMREAHHRLTADVGGATEKTGHLVAVLELTRGAAVPDTKKAIGRRLGNAALVLGAVPLADKIANAWDADEQQYQVRRGALRVRSDAKHLDRTLGIKPSIAQFSQEFNLQTLPILQEKYGKAAKSALQQAQGELLTETT